MGGQALPLFLQAVWAHLHISKCSANHPGMHTAHTVFYKALAPCCIGKPGVAQPGCMKMPQYMARGISEAPILAALQEPWCWVTWGAGAGTSSGKEQEPPRLLVEITQAV